MFVQIIHDPPTEEVSIMFCNESLQIAFPNNVLVASFKMNVAKVNSLSESSSEERGGVSRAH